MVQDLMAYDEFPYKVVHQTDKYEIRFYEERLVVQTQYTNQNNGFRKLFNYISMGLPVVCSDLPSVRNLIPSGHPGVIFIPSGDHKKCIKEITCFRKK